MLNHGYHSGVQATTNFEGKIILTNLPDEGIFRSSGTIILAPSEMIERSFAGSYAEKGPGPQLHEVLSLLCDVRKQIAFNP